MVDIGKVPDKEYSMPSKSSLHSIIGFKFLMSNIFTTSKFAWHDMDTTKSMT